MKEIFASISVALGLIAYLPYGINIVRRRTNPHAFTWLIWATLTAIAGIAQLIDKGGPGAWVTIIAAFVLFGIFGAAIVCGERAITTSDWLCLAAAGAGIALWMVTDDPLTAVILVSAVDVIGALPTIRKAWNKPRQETAQTFAIGSFRFLLVIASLDHYSLVTVLFPATVVAVGAAVCAVLIIRRAQLSA